MACLLMVCLSNTPRAAALDLNSVHFSVPYSSAGSMSELYSITRQVSATQLPTRPIITFVGKSGFSFDLQIEIIFAGNGEVVF